MSLGSGAPRDDAARVSTAEVSFNRHVGAALELAQLVRRCGSGGGGNIRERSLAHTRVWRRQAVEVAHAQPGEFSVDDEARRAPLPALFGAPRIVSQLQP